MRKRNKNLQESNLRRAKFIGHSGHLIAGLAALGAVLAPSSNYPVIGTILVLFAFALVPFTTIITAMKNLDKAGQANLNALVFSVLSINLMFGGVILALALTNQITAAVFASIVLGPYIYMGLKILVSVKREASIGSGSNPALKKIWLTAGSAFLLAIAIGMLF